MLNKRQNIRYPTLARVRVDEIYNGEALLKDLSITGCCIEYTVHADVEPGRQYRIKVLPERASKVDGFELLAESKWVRPSAYSCEIGFAVVASPKGKMFQRYVDYLTWRSSTL